jgi:GrpB-like predicted nucleotidyltransferase (UPF0157 family)
MTRALMPSPTVVRLVAYNPQWPELFEREASRIRAALDAHWVTIEHVGSTSVPGLVAKPILDILLVVTDSANEALYAPALQHAGYRLQLREAQWNEHRLFKGPDTEINLHVFSRDCSEIERMLGFRNWLRENAADRELYSRTKSALAAQAWSSVDHYADAKTAVVEAILARAVAVC